ncbi:cytochrome P450 [Frankia sp. CNm7]|uniref:Cytochrome P450 n=1 Tax=Frankia nepalensis TaxID=1836974 RepID=A0A937US94_9ACTN|nr:cytochrome P450 [Frankia nepalensis]MBL7500056.1 cytochrome P450 [Frankia nepalensis]MBL7509410.1 cytochrome P450 [Frankia nepalensis]MBL7519348.1 cytochrome P450 [Frankia nepalensis]MBL7631903.1 cytochrome P450 [Frankia nepalensis]
MTDLTTEQRQAFALASRYPAHVDAARLYGEEFHRDAAGLFRALRARHGAVAPALLEGDLPVWLVLGYREMHYVLTRPELFDRRTPWNALDLIPPDWSLQWILATESVMRSGGEEHERRSTVLHDALAAVNQFELRARCERIADALIDEFAAVGHAELMSQFAQQMPVRVVAWMLGFPLAEGPAVVRDLLILMDYTAEAPAAYGRLLARMHDLIRQRREWPTFDVASRMVHHPLAAPDDQLVEDMQYVVSGGQQPTAYWIGNTLRLLLTDTRFAMTLAGGRRSVGQAMGEVLWEDPPLANLSAYWAARACQMGGYQVQAGDMLVLGIAAAHTDPHIRPDQTTGAGGNQAHLAFGHGTHRCPFPAQELAEVIAETAIEVLLDRLPDLSLAVPADKLRWEESVWFRGLTGLPVVFTPA